MIKFINQVMDLVDSASINSLTLALKGSEPNIFIIIYIFTCHHDECHHYEFSKFITFYLLLRNESQGWQIEKIIKGRTVFERSLIAVLTVINVIWVHKFHVTCDTCY